jgi:hypothetical protein
MSFEVASKTRRYVVLMSLYVVFIICARKTNYKKRYEILYLFGF